MHCSPDTVADKMMCLLLLLHTIAVQLPVSAGVLFGGQLGCAMVWAAPPLLFKGLLVLFIR